MKLNNKGFTLIEVLATIVILALIVGISVPIISNAYTSAKNRAEDIYIDRLNKVIDEYLSLNHDKLKLAEDSEEDKIKKCVLGESNDVNCTDGVDVYKITKKDDSNIIFDDLINANLINESDFINPKDKDKCDKSAEINVYQDADKVYYYQYKLGCLKKESTDAFTYNNYPISESLEETSE